ncbi:30S ribosomal protein S20 [Candidatus Gottesmanbacteria bacterium]|nr:30S ribosomal protein S20 [Candidatus Gottesmanbacteria bacterium]
MPLTKQAIKKLRHDRVLTRKRMDTEKKLLSLVKRMRRKPSPKTLTQVFSALDKAAKTHIVHRNRASRLKSRLSRLLKKS